MRVNLFKNMTQKPNIKMFITKKTYFEIWKLLMENFNIVNNFKYPMYNKIHQVVELKHNNG